DVSKGGLTDAPVGTAARRVPWPRLHLAPCTLHLAPCTSFMAAAPSVDRTLADPGSYRHWHTIVPRFRDLDVLGHVNHGSTVSWLEEGRVMLELPIQPIEELTARPVFVLAEMRLRFLAEVR